MIEKVDKAVVFAENEHIKDKEFGSIKVITFDDHFYHIKKHSELLEDHLGTGRDSDIVNFTLKHIEEHMYALKKLGEGHE